MWPHVVEMPTEGSHVGQRAVIKDPERFAYRYGLRLWFASWREALSGRVKGRQPILYKTGDSIFLKRQRPRGLQRLTGGLSNFSTIAVALSARLPRACLMRLQEPPLHVAPEASGALALRILLSGNMPWPSTPSSHDASGRMHEVQRWNARGAAVGNSEHTYFNAVGTSHPTL